MRLVKFLLLAALLALAGCFEGTISSTGNPETSFGTRFEPANRLQYLDKVILASYAGPYGPSFLTPTTLWRAVQSAGSDSGSFSLMATSVNDLEHLAINSLDRTFGNDLWTWQIPWLDSTLWVDVPESGTTMLFYYLPPVLGQIRTSNGISGGYLTYDLANCPDLKSTGSEHQYDTIVSIKQIVRSGNYVYLQVLSKSPRFSPGTIGFAGIVQIRLEPVGYPADSTQWIWNSSILTGDGQCRGFSDSIGYNGIAARWVTDTSHHRYIRGMAGSHSGIWILFDDQKGYKLSRIDSSAKESLIDSSVAPSHYLSNGLISFNDKVWGVGGSGIIRLFDDPPRQGPAIPNPAGIVSTKKCGQVKNACILYSQDRIWSFDTSLSSTTQLDASGLEGNQITGVVEYKDTVYVSTLSGVFTKPLARFFETAK